MLLRLSAFFLVASTLNAAEPPSVALKQQWQRELPPFAEKNVLGQENYSEVHKVYLKLVEPVLLRKDKAFVWPQECRANENRIYVTTHYGIFVFAWKLGGNIQEAKRIGDIEWHSEPNPWLRFVVSAKYLLIEFSNAWVKYSDASQEFMVLHATKTGGLSVNAAFVSFVGDNVILMPPTKFTRNLQNPLHSPLHQINAVHGKLMHVHAGNPFGRENLEQFTDAKLWASFFLGGIVSQGADDFAIVEYENAISVIRFQAAKEPPPKAATQWLTPLLKPKETVHVDFVRRVHAATPTLVGEQLVCPTNCGSLFLVDAKTGKQLWQHEYAKYTMTPLDEVKPGWLAKPALVAEGTVVYTPPEANLLLAVSLKDGKQVWKTDRGEGLYLAGVHEGKVLVVEEKKLVARALIDGKIAWEAKLPNHTRGYGVRRDGEYYLSLGDRIAVIDLKDGAIKKFFTAKDQKEFGNLVIQENILIAHSPRVLCVYDLPGK